MECEVDRKEFLTAVKICRQVANGRVKPIFGCVRLQFKGDTCLMQATDGSMAIQISVPVGGDQLVEFTCCVAADLLASVLSGPSGDQVTLVLGQELLVKTTSSQHKLLLAESLGFPELPPIKSALAVAVGAVLAAAIQRVVYGCDEKSARYAMGAVLFDLTNTGWTVVATDGRRLSACRVGQEKCQKEVNALIPASSCRFVASLLSGVEGEVSLGLTETNSSVIFQAAEFTFWSRLSEGRFPAYRDVIPKNWESEASTPAGLLLNAIQESRIYTNRESRGVKFNLDEDQGLTILAGLASVGSAEIAAPVRYEGQPFAIELDPRLLAEFLQPLSAGKSVSMKFSGPEGPVLLETDGGDYLGVVMPLVLS